jgi:threonylcarbamoyladenosine tRNA methylthiotransferase MtaB
MNRRYSVSGYRALIERAIRLVPDLGLGTDLMVGFPGEDDRAFADTLAVARDLPFDYFHVFSFSTRPGTAAARLRGRVPPALIRARARTLTELSRAKRLASYRRLIGTTCSVLFETRDECGRWTGLTGAYMRVGVTSGEPLRNQIREVLVTGAMDGLAVGEVSVKRRRPLPLLTFSGAAQ